MSVNDNLVLNFPKLVVTLFLDFFSFLNAISVDLETFKKDTIYILYI